jgi:cytosine/adenosine deaminase-related metal-dependent hydrolase
MLRIATRGGAQVLGWDMAGSLEPGKLADLILIDTKKLDFAGSIHDPVSSIVLFGVDHLVDTTIVNGKIVVEGGRLAHVDEEALVERANRLSEEFIERVRKRVEG